LAGPTGVEALIAECASKANPPTDQAAAKLSREVATFLRLRYIDQEPGAYIEWRRSRGGDFTDIQRLDRMWSVRREYEVVLGKPAPSDATIEDLFRALWPMGLRFAGGANDLLTLPADNRGVAVRFDTQKGSQIERYPLTGDHSPGVWHGAVQCTLRSWFDPKVHAVELIKTRGSVHTAEVGLIVGFRDGTQRAMVLCFYHDPNKGCWVLLHFNQNNSDRTRVGPLEY
jgi:hypothetical protein